ncbi:unnamed protein product [Rhodiola kirilowii]
MQESKLRRFVAQDTPPQIAILGAGTFVKTQYIPRLAEISHLFILKSIWSRLKQLLNWHAAIFPRWNANGVTPVFKILFLIVLYLELLLFLLDRRRSISH